MDRMKIVIRVFLILMVVVAANVGGVNATVILNTGEPPIPVELDGSQAPLKGVVLEWSQWLAIRFTLDQTYDLMNAKGYAYTIHPGDLTVAIHSDYGGLPGGTPIYSETFYSGATSMAEWQGVSGMNWRLGPGTYWLALEVYTVPGVNPHGTTFTGGMYSYDQFGRHLPLPGMASLDFIPSGGLIEGGFTTPESPSYWRHSGYVEGWRLVASPVHTAVPEPSRLLLLSSGLIGLAGFAKKKFKK